jgi:hypothetical protein
MAASYKDIFMSVKIVVERSLYRIMTHASTCRLQAQVALAAAVTHECPVDCYAIAIFGRRLAVNAGERTAVIASIVARVADYRLGEIPRIEPAVVQAWWEQFDEADRPAVLRVTDRLLRTTYISREGAKRFIANLAINPDLTRGDPGAFWRSVGFLRIQRRGVSQRDTLALLGEVLHERFGLGTDVEHSPANVYVYLDDVSCSGNRIRYDLQDWVNQHDIHNATVHAIASVFYSNGLRYVQRQLRPLLVQRGITLRFWAPHVLENRLEHAFNAQVFWPTHLPDNEHVNAWRETFQEQPHFRARHPGGAASTALFPSEAERETIEQAFLKKGAYIYTLPANPNASMRPLGFMALRSPGFGSTVATYRNCPNNAPLPLWWGNPAGPAPLSRWTPLLPRRVGEANQGADYGF